LVTLKNFTVPFFLICAIIQTNLTTVTDSPITKFHLHITPLSQSNNSINIRTAKTVCKNDAKRFPTITEERKCWKVKCTLTLSHKHTDFFKINKKALIRTKSIDLFCFLLYLFLLNYHASYSNMYLTYFYWVITDVLIHSSGKKIQHRGKTEAINEAQISNPPCIIQNITQCGVLN
jgi:hypothetical protein